MVTAVASMAVVQLVCPSTGARMFNRTFNLAAATPDAMVKAIHRSPPSIQSNEAVMF